MDPEASVLSRQIRENTLYKLTRLSYVIEVG